MTCAARFSRKRLRGARQEKSRRGNAGSRSPSWRGAKRRCGSGCDRARNGSLPVLLFGPGGHGCLIIESEESFVVSANAERKAWGGHQRACAVPTIFLDRCRDGGLRTPCPQAAP